MWLPWMLVFVILRAPAENGGAPMDFARLAEAIGEHIAVTGPEGVVREGLLTAATADVITMKFAAAPMTFPKSEVVSADRLRDRTRDGFIKGAAFGGIMALIVSTGYRTGVGTWISSMATYGAIGWFIDAANTNRQTIYRAPVAPALKMSFRF